MADKPRDKQEGRSSLGESVADYARREMNEQAEREARKKAYWEGQAKVATELPERFFKLTAKVRDEVDTFNQIVDPTRRITFGESAGLAARADHTKYELNLKITRGKAEAWLGLTELMRLGRAPSAYMIEAQVRLSQGRIRIRAEGLSRPDGNVRYRVTIDGQEAPFGLEELGSRLVLAVAKDDPQILGAPPEPV